MPHSHLLDDCCRKDARGEGAAEDVAKLLVKAANAHLGEGEIGLEDGLAVLVLEPGDHDRRAARLGEQHLRHRAEHTALHHAPAAARVPLDVADRLEAADGQQQVDALALSCELLTRGHILPAVALQDQPRELLAINGLTRPMLARHDVVDLDGRRGERRGVALREDSNREGLARRHAEYAPLDRVEAYAVCLHAVVWLQRVDEPLDLAIELLVAAERAEHALGHVHAIGEGEVL